MAFHRPDRGRSGRGRGGQHQQYSWQRRMFTKLVKDGDATFGDRDVQPFIQGMESFESKPELLTILTDVRNVGERRLHECLSMISGPECVDAILYPILSNIITKETARPLHKARRKMAISIIFYAPGLMDFLSTEWLDDMKKTTIDATKLVCELLIEASLSILEARSSNHVKTIAKVVREYSCVDTELVHRLCAIVQLDKKEGVASSATKERKSEARAVACWGSDLEPPGERHDNDHSNFRDISLVPTQEELAYHGRSWLPLSSGENSFIGDPEQHLLDKNFRLLREDAVGAMRENIVDPPPSKVWKNARIIGASCKDVFNPRATAPLYFLVQLEVPKGKKVDWKQQRALPNDGLIAFYNDKSSHVIASTFVRRCDAPGEWLLSKGGPIIGVIFHHDNDVRHAINDIAENKSTNEIYQMNAQKLLGAASAQEKDNIRTYLSGLMKSFKTYSIVEASDSFFAYRPVLESIRSMISVPLAKELVHLQDTEPRPDYLPRIVKLPSMFNNMECDLDNWCNTSIIENTSLDISQSTAVHLALTSRVGLIQGPPGTGKTFIGSLIAQVIRQNSDESILCVCYTNHALDQFLEHMLKLGEKKLVRIGGRTKSKLLEQFELRALSKKEKSLTVSDADRRMRAVIAQLHRCKEEMTEYLDLLQMPLRWNEPNGGVNALFSSMGGNIDKNFCIHLEDGYAVVGRNNTRVDEESVFIAWKDGQDCPIWLQENLQWEDLNDFQNLWLLDHVERLELLNEWKNFHTEELMGLLQEVNQRYKQLSEEKSDINQEIDSYILSKARIIGATTTGAAKYRDLLSIKSAAVVIVEEAGEVLEPHVISSLTERKDNSEETKHLILIGDHLQLRPKVESYSLTKVSRNGYDFDVSIFERLILSGFTSSMLKVQHRMRPCIADVIRRQTYPSLEDHTSVSKYPSTMGVPLDMLFLDHSFFENGANDSEMTTKSNSYEASMCAELVRFFLLQGYRHDQVTILTPYVGQILAISREMKKRVKDVSTFVSDLDQEILLRDDEFDANDIPFQSQSPEKNCGGSTIRCASIDNFQGEESDIIVISLVRSNKQGSIGFLKEEQRVNVLLSRAKHGMFIIGNASTLCSSPRGKHVWAPIISMFEQQNRLVKSFPTSCQMHPTDGVTYCSTLEDFRTQRPNGGCCRPCSARLECGHACPLMCHPIDTNHLVTHKQCIEPCRRIPPLCSRKHSCKKLCKDDCGPCLQIVENTLLPCGHVAKSPTCDSIRDSASVRKLAEACREEISYKFTSCNHLCTTSCGNANSDVPICPGTCGKELECGHHCQRRCNTCEGKHLCKQRCEKTLFCGHVCGRICHGSEKCPPCNSKCEVMCVHSKCLGKCQNVCSSCVEDCDWQCDHRGSCTLVCGAPCNRLPCEKRCDRLLKCGHRCPSVCGEDCPSEQYCIECCSAEEKSRVVDMLEFNCYEDHDIDADPIIFLKCGHFYSMSTLDGVMEISNAYKTDNEGDFTGTIPLSSALGASKPASCPDCRSVIYSVKRYGRLISFHRLRALEMKHMMRVDIQLKKYSRIINDGSSDNGKIIDLVEKLERLEEEIGHGPMRKVYKACAGRDVDVAPPPSAPILNLKMLYALCLGKLVRQTGDEFYVKAISTHDDAIVYADSSSSIRMGSNLRINVSKLMMRWNSIDSIRNKIIPLLEWVIARGVDETMKSEAAQLKLNCERNERKEVLKAMHVVDGYDYGGGWSSHWYECPNGHPYFIGECGGAMQVGRCIECGEEVGGGGHQLLGTNRSASGAIEEELR